VSIGHYIAVFGDPVKCGIISIHGHICFKFPLCKATNFLSLVTKLFFLFHLQFIFVLVGPVILHVKPDLMS
jgi:hypothetical protein